MSDRRFFRIATTSTRLLIGTVVSVGAVVAVATAVTVPWPTLTREPVSVAAIPEPADTTLTCDGGIVATGRDLLSPGSLQLAAPQSITAATAPESSAPMEFVLAAPDLLAEEGPVVVAAPPEDGARTDIGAAGSVSVDADDLAGFAASACRPALMESWLMTGSASTGAADLVLLSNPGTVPATVQLTVYGAAGEERPPGGTDLVVAARTQRIVPLAGLASGEASPVIRVSASGAPVHASMQSSLTRVLDPGGLDQAGAVPAAAEVTRIVGVTVPVAVEGTGTVVRLLAPSADTEATVTVRRVGGGDVGEPITVPLLAAVPGQAGITDLAPGQYIVEVTAGIPIVAAAWQTTGFGAGSDFAWHLPAASVAIPTLFAVPDGPPATLVVHNPSTDVASVTITDEFGGYVGAVDLATGESASIQVANDAVYLLDSGGVAVEAAVTLAADGAVGAFTVWSADAAAPPIVVYP